MKKYNEAIKTAKLISIISGLGSIVLGLLALLWNDDVTNGGIMLFDGFFKFAVGYYFSGLLNIQKTNQTDDSDEENEEE